MSQKYDEYILQHKSSVKEAFEWLCKNTPELFLDEEQRAKVEYQIVNAHDQSKYSKEEYDAYDNYFYGNRSYEVVREFNVAWLHHIHNNPHHWQYWILHNDNPDEGMILLDMPDEYILEMICDWWSFSWTKGDLYEIFNWYNERKSYIKLSDETREKVEGVLDTIKDKLDEKKRKHEEQ